jgi:hypothetical protein
MARKESTMWARCETTLALRIRKLYEIKKQIFKEREMDVDQMTAYVWWWDHQEKRSIAN